MADARMTGVRLDPQTKIDLALTLPARNKAEMDDLARRLFDPTDPLYGHFLTPKEVNDRFGPTQTDYNSVVAFAKSKGLVVTQTWENRRLVDVTGPSNVVEAAFSTHLMQYRGNDGRVFYAPDAEPSVPATIASRLQGVIGLDSVADWQPQIRLGKGFSPTLKAVAPGGGDGGGGTGGGGTGGGGTSSPSSTSNVVMGNGALPGPRLSGYLGADVTQTLCLRCVDVIPIR